MRADMTDNENPICIVQRQSDGTFAYSEGRGEPVHELGNTLPGAVNALDKLGVHATHWLPQNGNMSQIPSGIARPHLPREDDVVAMKP